MKLVVQPFPLESLTDAWKEAATTGWLVHSPSEIRCGFGGVLRHLDIDSLEVEIDETRLFNDLDCEQPNLLTGFAAVPFSRFEAFTVTVPVVTVISRSNGEAISIAPEGTDVMSLMTTTKSPTVVPRAHKMAFEPTPELYATAVAEAVEHLRRQELAKVVLARSCHGEFSHAVSGGVIASRLHDLEPTCTIYSLPTSAGRRFVGASPELLVEVDGSVITCHPLAGTIANESGGDPSTYATWLMGSSKNRAEHRFVVEDIVERLSEVASDVTADIEPTIVNLRSVTHLGSFIRARRHQSTTSWSALRALHPTPAVGGLPREEAVDLIEKLEHARRGFYAGAVGWCNASGEGSWWVAIRGISFRGTKFEVWAGAGIVADSDPLAEREETRNKLDSVLHAIGVGTLN